MDQNLNNKLNLNGEFLGISSLAVYSAPWFLQFTLTLIIGVLFYYRVTEHSRNLVKDIEMMYNKMEDPNFVNYVKSYQKKFLGLHVNMENVPSYWGGFALFIITLIFSIINSLYHILRF